MDEPSETTFTDALSVFLAAVATSGSPECSCGPCVAVSAACDALYRAARTVPACV